MRQRNFVPIYAPGVTVGILRKMKEEPGRILDNGLKRPVKATKFPIRGRLPSTGRTTRRPSSPLSSQQTAICLDWRLMGRVVIIGRGASGKSSLARRLSEV